MAKCNNCKKLQLIRKYLPTIIHEAFTSAMNSGIIEEKVNHILKKLLDEEDDCCD